MTIDVNKIIEESVKGILDDEKENELLNENEMVHFKEEKDEGVFNEKQLVDSQDFLKKAVKDRDSVTLEGLKDDMIAGYQTMKKGVSDAAKDVGKVTAPYRRAAGEKVDDMKTFFAKKQLPTEEKGRTWSRGAKTDSAGDLNAKAGTTYAPRSGGMTDPKVAAATPPEETVTAPKVDSEKAPGVLDKIKKLGTDAGETARAAGSSLRKAAEDNPGAALAATGIASGLGALGLSKLLRRRR